MRNLILTVAALILLMAGLMAITRRPAVAPPDFVFINGTEPETVDPHTATGVPEWNIMIGMFEGLTTHHPRTLAVQPGLAERWEISPDGLTYTFHLREAVWSDGQPITSEDVVFSIERTLRPETASEYAYMVYELQNAEDYNQGRLKLLPAGTSLFEKPAGRGLPDAGEKVIRVTDTEPKLTDEEIKTGKKVEWLRVEDADTKAPLGWVRASHQVKDERGNTTEQSVLQGSEAGAAVITKLRAFLRVETPDARTVILHLDHPVPYLLDLLTHHSWWPVPRHTVEKWGDDKWFMPEHIVVSGAYTLDRWELNQIVTLKKNPKYYDAAKVELNTIGYLPIDNRNTAFNIFATRGKNSKSEWFPPPIVDQVRAQSFYHESPRFGVYFYRINTKLPAFKDKRVRRALLLALDRDYLVKHVMRGGEFKATQFVPPGIPGYEGAPVPDHNPELARKLLADAGFPGGKGMPPFEIQFNRDDVHAKMAESVQSMLKKELGIEVRLLAQEWKVYLQTQNDIDYDIGRAAWIGDYLDPYTFLGLWITGGGNNKTGWGNPRYDSLLKEANKMANGPERMAKLKAVEAIMLDELPVLPIFHYVNHDLYWEEEWGGIYGNLITEHNPKYLHRLKPGERDPYILPGQP